LEAFLVLDEAGCHRAILASVNRQVGEMLKLLSILPHTSTLWIERRGYHFTVSACVVAVVVCGDDARQIDFAGLNLLREHRQHTPINLGTNGLVPLGFGRVDNGRLFSRLVSNKVCIVVLQVNNPVPGVGEKGGEGRGTENMGIGVIFMAAARVA